MIKNFRTYTLAKELYQLTSKIKAKYHLKDQLNRASLSIVLNLAEGAGRFKPKDKMRFYTIAHGSLREVQAILDVLNEKNLYQKADRIGAHIWKLMQRPTNIPDT